MDPVTLNYQQILDDILETQCEDRLEVIEIRLRKRGKDLSADYVKKERLKKEHLFRVEQEKRFAPIIFNERRG